MVCMKLFITINFMFAGIYSIDTMYTFNVSFDISGMNSLTDVSISPALLQAISQTLTSKESGHQSTNMHPRIKIKQEILETKNASLSGSKTANENDTNVRIVNILQGMQKSSEASEDNPGHSSQYISPDDIKNMLKLKINQQNQKPDGQSVGNYNSGDQEAMVNVLTSLAMQQAKNLTVNSKTASNTEMGLDDNVPISSEPEEVVADQGTLMIDSVGQTFYVRTNADNSLGDSISSGEPQLQFSTSISSAGDMSSQGSMHSDMDVSCIPETAISHSDDNSMSGEMYQSCPVCGDNVSGQLYREEI